LLFTFCNYLHAGATSQNGLNKELGFPKFLNFSLGNLNFYIACVSMVVFGCEESSARTTSQRTTLERR
jgi:hypothetical protein